MNPDVKIIEIDVDGVLADLFGNKELKKMLKNAYPGWKPEHIKEYNFAHLKQTHPEAYNIIFNSFKNAKYMRGLPAYKGVSEGFTRLDALAQTSKLDICIHTLIFGGMEVIKARKDWLDDLRLPNHVRYQIDHEEKRMFNGSFILVEDSPDNLDRSNATHKILISQSYNEKYAEEHPDVIVANDFNHATQIIENLL